ncbi:hypothetical protein GF312_16235 [Candidatus Poribacteria bacterium]|nr:hypothetical protein [Candidatus Poribacteria bacterium]
MTETEKDVCKYCGCTDEKACPGGCYWVKRAGKESVCSKCVEGDEPAL